MPGLDEFATRKQLLVARADLDRLKLTIAVHDVRERLWPQADAAQQIAASARAARMVGFALPILGRTRLSRLVRAASIALVLYRFVRGFRR